jgi:TonB family protein
MPLNVKKFGVSWVLVFIFIFTVFAQTPTSGDVMRDRITKVKAMVALKQFTAAIYELEGIRRETNDATINNAAQVMLMNCYLEQADYKRAQVLLTELYNAQKANKPNANYYAVAAQVVKGARNQLDRYKSLGLSINDRNLPVNAVADIDKMRETVETVVTQSKELGANKKDASTAMALLEEATNARSGLARDNYDSKRWKEEVADARESLMNTRSVVNAVDDSGMQNAATNTVAPNPNAPKISETSTASIVPISTTTNAANNQFKTEPVKTEAPKTTEALAQNNKTEQVKAPENTTQSVPNLTNQVAQTPNTETPTLSVQTPTRNRRVQSGDAQTVQPTPNQNSTETSVADQKSDAPMTVGSLVEYATERINPTYPPAAKSMRMTGIVRVEVVVSEDGKVSVENTTGPSMLQRAALDAVKRWKFKPFTRDGQPVKAKGYVNFNFNL